MAANCFTHLECGSGCGAGPLDPREHHATCPGCGLPLLARYDLAAARAVPRTSLAGRPATMWRYRELMPLLPEVEPVTLGEGFTPLLHARRFGATLGLEHLLIKDESSNPTNSFKARGLSAAVTMAKALGARTIALPTAGNAGSAAAAYAAAAGLACEVFIPNDAKQAFIDECHLHGAEVTLVNGLIVEAGRLAQEAGQARGWYSVQTFREPYRVEGKKTMGYELAEQMDWTLPDWLVFPTGGGTGVVGLWKAFDEMEAIGWLPVGIKRPKIALVQAEGCCPLVRAFEQGKENAGLFENAHTIADGLRVPRSIGDFIILRAVRASGGTAVAVSDADLASNMRSLARLEGISAAPETGAALAALRTLTASGHIASDERVVVFNTAGAQKYYDLTRTP